MLEFFVIDHPPVSEFRMGECATSGPHELWKHPSDPCTHTLLKESERIYGNWTSPISGTKTNWWCKLNWPCYDNMTIWYNMCFLECGFLCLAFEQNYTGEELSLIPLPTDSPSKRTYATKETLCLNNFQGKRMAVHGYVWEGKDSVYIYQSYLQFVMWQVLPHHWPELISVYDTWNPFSVPEVVIVQSPFLHDEVAFCITVQHCEKSSATNVLPT